jgi:hypothetical protein
MCLRLWSAEIKTCKAARFVAKYRRAFVMVKGQLNLDMTLDRSVDGHGPAPVLPHL